MRMRLLVSHSALVLLLGIVMSAGIAGFVALGRGVDRVLEGNYSSIAAAHKMQEAIAMDLAGASELLEGDFPSAELRFKTAREEFDVAIGLMSFEFDIKKGCSWR